MTTSIPEISIYLAHPAFSPDQIEYANKLQTWLSEFTVRYASRFKVTVFNPFNYGPNIENDPEARKVLASTILESNVRLINRSSIVLALIDNRDAGVIWELGYAYARRRDSEATPYIMTFSAGDFTNNIMIEQSVFQHFTNIDSQEAFNSRIGNAIITIMRSIYE